VKEIGITEISEEISGLINLYCKIEAKEDQTLKCIKGW